jgi:ribosomal protein L7Ae-like RNA K-turn-binding protein
MNYELKIANILSLARKAGAITAGTELVIDSMRRNKACIVYISSEVSDGTLKKLKDKASFYKIQVEILDLTMDELAHCVGLLRPAAAVSLTDKNFLKLIEKINVNNSDGES